MSFKAAVKKLAPTFIMNWYYFAWVFFGALFFGFPGRTKKMKIIGVTGTSGKSTTVGFISAILEEAGFSVASVSSIRFKLGKTEWLNKYKMTMPGRFVIQKFLRRALSAKCDFMVLEVTSEGIKQFRHRFINFDAAVFTNLSPEHIESHGGFEKYRAEKMKLFKATKHIHVINQGDANAKYFWDIPATEKIGFYQSVPFDLVLEGAFNTLNAAAAVTLAKAYNVDDKTCQAALQKITMVPGRMEILSKKPKVVVDYAHTAEQLEQVYKSLQSKNLICVLGSCGGGRDIWKRPILGKIAAQYGSKIFLTNEDPYDEDPMEIIKQVAAMAGKNAEIVLNRKEAIEKAIKSAGENDTVIITGKGSEVWMCVANNKKIPWSDKQVVLDALRK